MYARIIKGEPSGTVEYFHGSECDLVQANVRRRRVSYVKVRCAFSRYGHTDIRIEDPELKSQKSLAYPADNLFP